MGQARPWVFDTTTETGTPAPPATSDRHRRAAAAALVFVNLSTQRSRRVPQQEWHSHPLLSTARRTSFRAEATPEFRPALYFYGTDGEPMAAESVVDITGDLEAMEDGGLTVQTEMEPNWECSRFRPTGAGRS